MSILINMTQLDGDGYVPSSAVGIDSTAITDGTIANADVDAAAGIAYSKLATLASGNILVGSVANVPTSVAMSGDATIVAAGTVAVSDLTIASEARGDILRRGAAAWERHSAKTSGQILVGDGTDIVSVAVSGDVTLSSAGAVTIANGKVKPAMLYASEALTATADGLTTGLMSGNTSHAVVTSAAATNAITLPASSAALVGKTFTLWVAANGFELLTPAASGATINTVDSDGTNQVDIPANTLSRATLVDTGTWVLENLTALGAVTTALIPDND